MKKWLLIVALLFIAPLGCHRQTVTPPAAPIVPIGEPPASITVTVPFTEEEGPADVEMQSAFPEDDTSRAWNRVVIAGNRWSWDYARGKNDLKKARALKRAFDEFIGFVGLSKKEVE